MKMYQNDWDDKSVPGNDLGPASNREGVKDKDLLCRRAFDDESQQF